MTDYYGVSGRHAEPEREAMTDAECERKIALLRASWSYFDDVASRVSPELRKGPRGGGRERDEIVRHVNGAGVYEHATKVGVRTPLEARGDPVALRCPSRGLLRGDPRVQFRRPIRREVVDRPVPDPALRVAHARPRLGDGRPGNERGPGRWPGPQFWLGSTQPARTCAAVRVSLPTTEW